MLCACFGPGTAAQYPQRTDRYARRLAARVVLAKRQDIAEATKAYPVVVLAAAAAAGGWVAQRYRVGTVAASFAWPIVVNRATGA